MSLERVEAALNVDNANPVDVWLLCDKLETAVKNNGQEPAPYSKLTDDKRAAAAVWFGVRDER